MNYFQIQYSLQNKKIGRISSTSMINYQTNVWSERGVYSIPLVGRTKNGIDLHSIKLEKSAKPFDLIDSIPVSKSGLIVTNKLMELLLSFDNPLEYEIFEASAISDGKKYVGNYHYNYLYFWKIYDTNLINFSMSEFYTVDIHSAVTGEYQFKNYVELNEFQTTKGFKSNFKVKTLFINPEINSFYDIFRLGNTMPGYYVSERLKNAIQEAECTGIDFTPVEELNWVKL